MSSASRSTFEGCDTGTSGQRQSDGNIELVRFLDSHEGDGARAVFAGVQLLYKNKTPRDRPSKIAPVKGLTANNLRGSVRYRRRPPAAASAPDRTRLRGNGLLDGSLVYRFGGWFEAGPASCPTARSRRFGGGFDSRRAWRLARRLARGASVEDAIRDGPGVLPDGSLAALRRMVRSRRARRIARRLARGASADRSRRAWRLPRRLARVSLRRMPNGSRDNCLTGKIR